MSNVAFLDRPECSPLDSDRETSRLISLMANGIDEEILKIEIERLKIEYKDIDENLPQDWGIYEEAYRISSTPEAIDAHDTLLLANLRLIKHMTNKLWRDSDGTAIEDDYFSAAISAASYAIWRYAENSPYKLSTAITKNIRWKLSNHTEFSGSLIYLPPYLVDIIRNLDNPPENVIEETLDRAQFVAKYFLNMKSLDGDPRFEDFDLDGQPITRRDTRNITEEITDESAEKAFNSLEEELEYAILTQAISKLNQRTQEILRLRFGFDSPRGEPMTLEEVGGIFNITRERVRQIEMLAVSDLRRELNRSLSVFVDTEEDPRLAITPGKKSLVWARLALEHSS